MGLPSAPAASRAIDRSRLAAPGVGVGDRSRGGLGFPLGEQLEGDLTTPRAR